jgi:Na+-translocating ferredoxin:NAD+ oxidoreductase RNF subunit RnfB
MGHLQFQGVYSKLQKRLDAYPVGAPESKGIYEILKILFSENEAYIASRMPLRLSTAERISSLTGHEVNSLKKDLDCMIKKGLIVDLQRTDGKTYYFLNPTVVGFFEFSMMRRRTDIDQKRLAHLLHSYMFEDPENAFINQVIGGETSLFRTLPNENSMAPEIAAEVLDYERSVEIVKNASAHSTGICHCRHVKEHLGKRCKFPIDNCTSLNKGANYIISSGLGKKVSREESLERLEEAKSLGMVQIGDNVRNQITFICHCCGCCCGLLEGFKKLRESNRTFSSGYSASVKSEDCEGCARCFKDCPVEAIELIQAPQSAKFPRRKKIPSVNKKFCLGCGVCQVRCPTKSIRLVLSPKRLIPPEDMFERVILMAIERGKLQNMIFEDMESVTHRVLRGVIGGILRLPATKKLLAVESLRSRFISSIVKKERKGF